MHDHSFSFLVSYHRQVVQVMIARGYKPDLRWMNPEYRGRFADRIPEDLSTWDGATIPYPEHTQAYFLKCVAVLRQKVLTKKIPVEDRVRMDREIDSQILAFVDESK